MNSDLKKIMFSTFSKIEILSNKSGIFDFLTILSEAMDCRFKSRGERPMDCRFKSRGGRAMDCRFKSRGGRTMDCRFKCRGGRAMACRFKGKGGEADLTDDE